MKTSHRQTRRLAGATLVEVLLGGAVASIILGALMTGSIALQRSFSASDRLARAQADLLRVSDYMARDIRNATSVNPTTASVLLSVTTGDYYDRRGTPNTFKDDVPNSPILGRNGVVYGTSPVTIRYLRSGTRVLREITRVDAGATNVTTTQIADNVDNLTVTLAAERAATITSDSALKYKVRKAGAPSPSLSLVMASQPRNPIP
jgi:Tfp pilus assembly protein PilW